MFMLFHPHHMRIKKRVIAITLGNDDKASCFADPTKFFQSLYVFFSSLFFFVDMVENVMNKYIVKLAVLIWYVVYSTFFHFSILLFPYFFAIVQNGAHLVCPIFLASLFLTAGFLYLVILFLSLFLSCFHLSSLTTL